MIDDDICHIFKELKRIMTFLRKEKNKTRRKQMYLPLFDTSQNGKNNRVTWSAWVGWKWSMDRWREVSRYVISAATKWRDTVQLQRKTIAIHISTCRAWMRRHYCVVAMITYHLSIIYFFFHIKIFYTISNFLMTRLSRILLRRRRVDKIIKFFRRSIVCLAIYI